MGKHIADKIKLKFKDANGDKVEITLREIVEKGIDPEQYYNALVKFEDLRASLNKKANFIDYMKAIEFCMYVIGGSSYTEAYKLTFPKKIKDIKPEWVSRYASIYSNGDLVSNVMARVYTSQYILFLDKSIQAKMQLYNIGTDETVAERDRINALDKFLIHVKKDEEQSIVNNNINILGGQNIVDAVERRLEELSKRTTNEIEKGIIDVEAVSSKEFLIGGSNE